MLLEAICTICIKGVALTQVLKHFIMLREVSVFTSSEEDGGLPCICISSLL